MAGFDDNQELKGPDFESGAQPSTPDERSSLQASEANPEKTEAPEQGNLMNYNANLGAAIDTIRSLSGGRKAAIGGGIAGSVIAVIFAMTAILPLKINGVIEMIGNSAERRASQVVTHRAKVIIARTILKGATGGSGDVVITGNGPVSSLIATMRTNKFEKKLAEKGLKIERNGDTVTLTVNETKLGTFKNEAAIAKALDANNLTRGMINSIVKEEIPSWRIMKRVKFATWLKLKYGIKYGVKKSSKTDKEGKLQEFEENRIATAAERSSLTATEGLNCLTGAPECGTQGDDSRSVSSEAADAPKQEATEVLNAQKDELSKTAQLAIKAGNKIGLDISVDAAKLFAKGTNVVGWVFLAADINHLVITVADGAESGKFAMALGNIRGSQYAQMYGDWAGYHSQIQLGEMDSDVMGYIAPMLDDIDQSQAFACLNSSQPIDVSYLTSTASAASSCVNTGEPIKQRIDQNNPEIINQLFQPFKDIFGVSTAEALKSRPESVVLEALYYAETAVGDAASWVAGKIAEGLIPEGIRESFSAFVNQILMSVADFALSITGLKVNTLARDAELMNNLNAGGEFSAETYCAEQLGCEELTAAEAGSLERDAIAEEREYIQSKGLLYALFSPDVTSSLTTQIALATPTTGGASIGNVMSGFASIVSRAPSSIAATINPSATAASYEHVDLYGLKLYGIRSSKLDDNVSPEAESGAECPVTEIGTLNLCITDKAVASGLNCALNMDIIETPECNGDAGSSSAAASPAGGCAANTKTLGVYDKAHDNGKQVSVTLCELSSIKLQSGFYTSEDPQIFKSGSGGLIVGASVSGSFQKLGEAALAENPSRQLMGKGIRSYEKQVYFYNCYIHKNCNNGNLAADPGTSNHENGTAVDFVLGSGDLAWLRASGSKFGLKELTEGTQPEPWHWSPTSK